MSLREQWTKLPMIGKFIVGGIAVAAVFAFLSWMRPNEAQRAMNAISPAATQQAATTSFGLQQAATTPAAPTAPQSVVPATPVAPAAKSLFGQPTPAMRAAEQQRYDQWLATCNDQAAKRRALGYDVQPQITGGVGQASTCHVEGGVTESGRI